jgi:hypothetical protein
MPLPTPRKGKKNAETSKEFISRCAANPTMNSEYPDTAQRVAVCWSQWKRSKKKRSAKGSLIVEAGDEEYIFDTDESLKDDTSDTPTA